MKDIPALKSRIQAVTVFHQGALVTRVADLKPVDGQFPSRVRVTGLPLSLDDASIRARVDGSSEGGVTPQAVDLRVALEVNGVDIVLPPAEDESLRAARQDEQRLQDRHFHIQRCIARLEALELPPRPRGKEGVPPAPSPTAARLALLQFRREQLMKLVDERQETERQLKREKELREDLENKYRAASSARQPRANELRKSIVVSLDIEGKTPPSDCTLFVEYMIPGARWTPAYSLQFNKELSRATLSVRALVCQRSGEDWHDVQLTLSTARAQTWAELPELSSLRIGKLQTAQRTTGWRMPPAGTQSLYAEYDQAFAAGFQDEKIPHAEEDAAPQQGESKPVEKARGSNSRASTSRGSRFMTAVETQPRDELSEGLADLTSPPVPGAAMASMASMAPALPQPPPPPPPQSSSTPGNLRVRSSRSAAITRILPAVPASSSIVADERFLKYGKLRMPGATSPMRGRLCLANDEELYMELLASAQIQIAFSVHPVMAAAVKRANEISQPPGRSYLFPETVEGFDYAYSSETALSLPSDGQFHLVPLCTMEADSRKNFVTVPRETQDVFRFVEFENRLNAPLLAGDVDIYIAGDFVMTAALKMVPPRGMARLGLGVEQTIKVSRNTSFAEESSRLTGSTLSLRHEIEIELINHLDQPASVEVRERVPVTREGDDQAKVQTQASPAWERYSPDGEDLKGGYRWVVLVPPGKSKQLHAEYTIQVAARHELNGGNRRER